MSRHPSSRCKRGTSVLRGEVLEALIAMGVPRSLAENMPALPADLLGLLVYGSQARGDAVESSDLDLLGVVPSSRPSASSGNVNLSYYTIEQLNTGIGTLFGFHLKRDSRVLVDEFGYLRNAIDVMGEVETGRLLDRARNMSQLFTTLDRDLPKYLRGLLREARYLLRSCLYAQAISVGEPCFSVRALSVRHHDPALVTLLASRQVKEPAIEDLYECLSRLQQIVGEFPLSAHGSLEATVVNEWGRPGDVLSMAFMALGSGAAGGDYAEVEKILL